MKDLLLLVCYDVSTQDAAGRKRLSKIAKECLNYGQRVQNSVFECVVDASEGKMLEHKLCKLMDETQDSLRFYSLGKNYKEKVKHFGVKETYDPEGVLII